MPQSIDIRSILDTPLNKDSLRQNVFDRIAKNKSFFYSDAVSSSMQAYIKSKYGRKEAKKLWKELLIDSICLLKINDSREKTFEIGSVTDLSTFKDAFNKVRNISSFGIDELEEYFDDFVEFESVLYNEKFYRDHIHHVIQVWGIGIGLLFCKTDDKVNIKLPEDLSVSDDKFHNQGFSEYDKPITKISTTELWAMWTIIALCHDLGYPLEKSSKINQKVKKIVNHFGCLSFNELNFKFDLLNSFLIDKFLKIISSKPVDSPPKINIKSEAQDKKAKPTYHTEVQQKYLDKFSKSLEDYKHGMFSGLLIFKKLVYFLETDFAPDANTISHEDRRQFIIRREILRAICGHTCPKVYHLKLNTLSFLLILCDEIQEWSRPRFEDVIDGLGRGSAEESEELNIIIEEFETKEDKVTISVYTDYEKRLDGNPDTAYALVIKKYRDFVYLLRSAKNDKDRCVLFNWKIKFNDVLFKFSFDSSSDSAPDFTTTYSFIDPSASSSADEALNESSPTGETQEEIPFDVYSDEYKKAIKPKSARTSSKR